jgi:GrpB-like predicted nucleotidyltransferase (UPF0157 family)
MLVETSARITRKPEVMLVPAAVRPGEVDQIDRTGVPRDAESLPHTHGFDWFGTRVERITMRSTHSTAANHEAEARFALTIVLLAFPSRSLGRLGLTLETSGLGGLRQHWSMVGGSRRDLGDDEEAVRIVPYDAGWPEMFEVERAALEPVVGPYTVGGIHHVGSTAVPGLAAKPVIDVLVGVGDLASSRACFEPLAQLGYLYAPYRSTEMHWFCKPSPARRTHHLHLVPAGSQRFRDELVFRDELRRNPVLAANYATLKLRLAARFERNREAYTQAKSEFIQTALDEYNQRG